MKDKPKTYNNLSRLYLDKKHSDELFKKQSKETKEKIKNP